MTVDLRIYESVLTGTGLMGHVRPEGDQWRRSIRSTGGFWQGTLTLRRGNLWDAFYTWLGGHIQEKTGTVTWEGLIYEMELELMGVIRRRSLDLLANAVWVSYQSGGEVTTTSVATRPSSISRYGRKEVRLAVDNVPSATAQGLRGRYLAGHAWPWARPVAVGTGGGETVLTVSACGYVFTGNWMYLEAGDGSDDDIDDWISAIVGTAEGLSSDHGGSTSGAGDCQFLSAGNLATNTLQVKTSVDTDTRPWSKIAELAGLGDSDGDPWRAWVDVNRKLHYQEVDLSPRYYLRDGELYDTAGGRVGVNPWALRPGVVRDMEHPVRHSARGSMLEDGRDMFVDEVEVNAAGEVSLKTEGFDESEIRAAQAGVESEIRAAQAEAE